MVEPLRITGNIIGIAAALIVLFAKISSLWVMRRQRETSPLWKSPRWRMATALSTTDPEPFEGVRYTAPGPPDLEPVIMALDDPMRVDRPAP